ncbi:gamma-glutamyltranspeptidase / glutathione hydrolase [Colwellia chukchiensis]|uniref:Glutathione hydrolase proenzyme n=1 Tax=Colwellia chukchiensis TaxID=641665 RepID=A0A1H7R5N8_9GAMM|nr:gamma-glutamyltransferase [Colwellia chukchiensis]SEL55255.1 gamma-glutamyltranspeptidase / glutathione hydrolase [Colwellia chukchiensis]
MINKFLLCIALISYSLTVVANQPAKLSSAAVAMPDGYSADVAAKILAQGGNAVDAAIAAQFVLAVTLPEAGNVGGGGFMVIYKDKQSDFLDYREVAPLKAHRDMYLDDAGNVIANLSLYGALSAGVPGTVDGMWQAHKKYGSLPWKSLVMPAVTLAKQGFIVDKNLEDNIKWRIESFQQQGINVNFAEHFAKAKTGTVFKQKNLAKTLQRIADQGRNGFYHGETAQIIADFMNKHGGIIGYEDLKNYRATWRKPLQKSWRGYQVITAPPPSSGGIAILQWLNMYDLLADKTAPLAHNSAPYMHRLAEIGKRVFADRAEYLGDPDFYEVPQAKLLADSYLKTRIADISDQRISVTKTIQPGLKESRDTTHFSIIDKWGNAVSNTTTINYTFGSGVIVDGAGFILNDEMDDFSVKPGVANVYGAVGGKANEIQANKRMLSSMTPTILLKGDQVKLVTGSPGGTTIISSVYQSILNVIEFDMNAEQAVNAPRFHHQLLPKDVIEHYPGIAEQEKTALLQLGYQLKENRFGAVQLIIANAQSLDAAAESGGRGKAIVLKH